MRVSFHWFVCSILWKEKLSTSIDLFILSDRKEKISGIRLNIEMSFSPGEY